MKRGPDTIFVTHDGGLLAHWQRAMGKSKSIAIRSTDDFFRLSTRHPLIAWVDLATPGLPPWNSEIWHATLKSDSHRIVATSSNPNDNEAMLALDAGCVAYCHAFSDAVTLKQVREVVEAGQVWIGKNLMQRLLQSVHRALPAPEADRTWSEGLTQREEEVAILAANGASNQSIAIQCQISERTVKAHLSAVFGKLNITDRLQLALRVHGIQ